MKINKSLLCGCGFALGTIVFIVIAYLYNKWHNMNDIEQLVNDDYYCDDFLVYEDELFPSNK